MATAKEVELWMALSELFVDKGIDFVNIARNVCEFSMAEIEFALLQRVAPVCVWNMMTPAPEVWLWFTEEEVIPEIEHMIERRAKRRWWGSVCSIWTLLWMRLFCISLWKTLKAELIKIEIESRKD